MHMFAPVVQPAVHCAPVHVHAQHSTYVVHTRTYMDTIHAPRTIRAELCMLCMGRNMDAPTYTPTYTDVHAHVHARLVVNHTVCGTLHGAGQAAWS